MLRDWKFLVLLAVVLLGAGLVAQNVRMHREAVDLRAQLAHRQNFLEESVRLSQFSNQFIQALANLAAQTSDESIRRLLAEHGVTFTVNAGQTQVSAEATDD